MDSTRYPGGFIPRPRSPKKSPKRPFAVRIVAPMLIAACAIAASLFSLPLILAADIELAQSRSQDTSAFPITVDPATKTIVTDPQVEAFLETPPQQLPAAAGTFQYLFQKLALKIAQLPVYQQLAGVAGVPNLFVAVNAGDRQEQVASNFGSELGWTATQRRTFIADSKKLEPDLPQGSTVPGIYFASVTDPNDVATLLHDRFDSEILSRYSTSTEQQVPLTDALTIASLIQREAGSWDDMRMISGIIWNRLFAGMRLQVDATLQYASANQAAGRAGWWPAVVPKDKYIKSAYNTYQNAGLPPAPIANPSIAAVLAALNPKKTDCLFYFHDSRGVFHCSKTYAEHVALLKKYYGQGK